MAAGVTPSVNIGQQNTDTKEATRSSISSAKITKETVLAHIINKFSYTGVLNVRLGPEIHSGAAMAASKSGITINAFIKSAVARALGMAL